jgi:hypothetical protein
LEGALENNAWKGKVTWKWEDERIHISSVRLSYDCSDLHNDEIITPTDGKDIQIWNGNATVNVRSHRDEFDVLDMVYSTDIGFCAEDWKTLVKPKCDACFNQAFWGNYTTVIRCYGGPYWRYHF